MQESWFTSEHTLQIDLRSSIGFVMTRLVGENLVCQRGGRTVLDGVSFALEAGQLLQVMGPNGAGKSTLLRLVAGLSEVSSGTLALQGGEAELTIGQQSHYAAHQEAIKTRLTVAENLRFWNGFLGGGDMPAALAAFDLARLADFPAAYLSAGQRRRLSLSRLALVPRLLWLLDEPATGLDAASQEMLAGHMRSHLMSGGMIIAATHAPIGLGPDFTLTLGGAA